jgi:hypothetical protein
MHVIVVSSAYHESLHGPWQNEATARKLAERWNRVFAFRGWPLTARVRTLMPKDAGSRDEAGAILVEMTRRSTADELLRVDARPCECEGFTLAAGGSTEENPGGLCTCGHPPDEHDDEFCDGMVLPDSTTKGPS